VDASPNELQSPSLVKAYRCFVIVLLLGIAFVTRSYAGGAYQRSDDRKKTFVWNNDPQPGDTATWSGGRDAEGYATGPGTLTWSRFDRGFATGSNVAVTRKRIPISSYSGTMKRGKFNGGVTTVDRGKTYHATFVDGQRKGNWAAGPLITKGQSAEPAPAVAKAEIAKPAMPAVSEAEGSTSTEKEAATSEKVSEEKKPAEIAKEKKPEPVVETEDIPAAGPAEEKPEVTDQKTESVDQKSESAPEKAEAAQKAPLIAQASTEEADQSATPRQQPVTRKGALAPGAVRAIEKPAAPAAKKTEAEPVKKTPKAAEVKTEKPAKPVKPAPSAVPSPETKPQVTEASKEPPAEGPPTVAKEEIPQPPTLHTSPPAAKEMPADDSIRTLTGPPSALKTKPTAPQAATSPPAKTAPPEPAAASSPPPASPPPTQNAAKLTAVNAMDIADIEARTRGYDLGEYQLPKAEYNSANDTWSVAYTGRDAEGAAKKFSVIVQDKSGKAEVKK
jgi:hypothetical protein